MAGSAARGVARWSVKRRRPRNLDSPAVLSDAEKQQVVALGQLGGTLRRISRRFDSRSIGWRVLDPSGTGRADASASARSEIERRSANDVIRPQ